MNLSYKIMYSIHEPESTVSIYFLAYSSGARQYPRVRVQLSQTARVTILLFSLSAFLITLKAAFSYLISDNNKLVFEYVAFLTYSKCS